MSFYRTTVFGIKGLSEYTRSGFESASRRFNPKDTDVDMSDQHIMITGANSVIYENIMNYYIIMCSFFKGCWKNSRT